MNWFFIALTCAFSTACCDGLSKYIMRDNDEWITGTAILGISLVFMLPVFLSCECKPFTPELAVLFAVVLPLEIVAYYLFLSSIRMAALSLTVPLLAFTPVLTIASSALILGEKVSTAGAVGISLVTVGAYILNGNLANQSFWAPIRALFSHPGSRRMFLVAVIWAVTSSLGKKGVLLYDPIPFSFLLVAGDLIIFALITLFRVHRGTAVKQMTKSTLALLFTAGVFMAGAELTHFVAVSMAPVAYMISVKRLSLVFGVLLGWIFFGERNMVYRLTGASTMVCGVFFMYSS
jgi:drug/metabolite transporter (DMT)-like permease